MALDIKNYSSSSFLPDLFTCEILCMPFFLKMLKVFYSHTVLYFKFPFFFVRIDYFVKYFFLLI